MSKQSRSGRGRHRAQQTGVEIYAGRGVADRVFEPGPDGQSVTHLKRRDGSPVDRMHQAGTIDRAQLIAADRFHQDFVTGHLSGHYASLNLSGFVGAGGEAVPDAIVRARRRIDEAMRFLSNGKTRGVSAAILWHVVGEQDTLKDAAIRMRLTGISMNEQRAAGVLIGALERMAYYYGVESRDDVRQLGRREGYRAGLAAAATKARQMAKRLEAGPSAQRQDARAARALRRLSAILQRHHGKND